MLSGVLVLRKKVEWLLDEVKTDYAFNYKNAGENDLS